MINTADLSTTTPFKVIESKKSDSPSQLPIALRGSSLWRANDKC